MNAFVHYRHLPSLQPFSKATKRFDWLQKQKRWHLWQNVVVSEHPCSGNTLSYKKIFVNPFLKFFQYKNSKRLGQAFRCGSISGRLSSANVFIQRLGAKKRHCFHCGWRAWFLQAAAAFCTETDCSFAFVRYGINSILIRLSVFMKHDRCYYYMLKKSNCQQKWNNIIKIIHKSQNLPKNRRYHRKNTQEKIFFLQNYWQMFNKAL